MFSAGIEWDQCYEIRWKPRYADQHNSHTLVRWRGGMMLKSVPKEQWPEVRIKSATIEGLNGRKKQYGLRRRWLGDYLRLVSIKRIINLFHANAPCLYPLKKLEKTPIKNLWLTDSFRRYRNRILAWNG